MESQQLKPARVLVVDDDPMILKAWRHMLNKEDEFEVTLVASGQDAVRYLASCEVDVVLTDVLMDGMSGLELLDHVKRGRPEVEVIIMTGQAKIADAVYATKAGAYDYITKPFLDVDACINRVRQAARLKRLSDENLRLRQQGSAHHLLQSDSPAMQPVVRQVRRLAKVDATVLLSGPTGAGKSAIARALHDLGRRAQGPFVHVDCGAIPEKLIESELFGHVKGSFTGAAVDKKGLFEEADGGTLFLDEIGNLPLELQPKLLRALNDGVVRRVGDQRAIEVDVRLISATNVDLAEAVARGAFREDLFYRLNVVGIQLPPLNDRREDIPALAFTILRREAARHGSPVRSIQTECLERLCAHDWKGNIRELQNVLERAVIFETGEELSIRSLPDAMQGAAPAIHRGPISGELIDLELPWREAVDAAESAVRAAYLRAVLERYDGNVTQAAKHAELDRSNFRRHLKRYVPDYT